MTLDRGRLPHQLHAQISTRIINEVTGANRICCNISSKSSDTTK